MATSTEISVHDPELDHPPQCVVGVPVGSPPFEVLEEQWSGQAAVHLELGVAPFPGSFDEAKGRFVTAPR